MVYKMVDLDISDLLAKTSLAYVLDREGVPERMYEIRKAWGVEESIASKEFQEWLSSYHDDLTLTKEAADYYSNNIDQFEIEDSRDEKITANKLQRISKFSRFNIIDFEIELLMNKFGINPKYKKVITKAIICNEINNNDLGSLEATDSNYDFLLDSQELRFVVEKIYKGRGKTDLDRDRVWYWKWKNKIKLEDIAYEFNEDPEKVDTQIDRYKRFLQKGTSK